MTWPTTPVSTVNLDAGTDSPALARADILGMAQKLNQAMAHPSAYAQTLLDDPDAATARTTLGAVGTSDTQTVTGPKQFSGGIGVGAAAAQSGTWTLTGWTKPIAMAAGSVLWWAKGAATRALGIGRTTDDVLRIISSTADDDSAAATSVMTVDLVSGDLNINGKITTSNGALLKGAGASNSGILQFEKPATVSTLAGDISNYISGNVWVIVESLGSNRGVQFDLSKAPAGAGGIIPFIVARGGTPSSGWRRWYLGVDEFIIEQWGRSALQPDFGGSYTLGIGFPTAFLSSVDDVQLTIADEASAQTVNLAADWRRAATTLSTLSVFVRETGGAVQANFTIGFHAWGR